MTKPAVGGVHEVLSELVNNSSFELPLLPESTSKLICICNDPDFRASELAIGINRDQSIATHVLRMANSAVFSPGPPVVSLQQAVARLGVQRIRNIVLIVSCKSRVFDVLNFESYLREAFKNSLAVAVFAQEIARARRLNVEDAFLCGLLHDIGRPVLLQAMVDYQKTVGAQFERAELLEGIELQRTRVGTLLIEEWNLPKRVANVVACQDSDVATITDQASMILQLAIAFARSFLHPDEALHDSLLNHPIVDQLNLYPEEIESIQERSAELFKDIGGMQ